LQVGTVPWANVSSKPAEATRWPTWSEVTSKPSTFPPSAHNHAATEITSGNLLSARLPNIASTWAIPGLTLTGMTAGLAVRANAAGYYGWFEAQNSAGTRGFYLGFGNGGTTVELNCNNASILDILGAHVRIPNSLSVGIYDPGVASGRIATSGPAGEFSIGDRNQTNAITHRWLLWAQAGQFNFTREALGTPMVIRSNGNIDMTMLPTSNPGGSGRLWRDASGYVRIT
jgi:hypothetical protein